MGVLARAAVEAPEGGRASENGAQPRPDISERRRFAGVARQMVGIAPFGASPAPGAATNLEAWCSKTRTLSRRENDFVYPPPRSET